MQKFICTPKGEFVCGLESAKSKFLFLDLINAVRRFSHSIGYKSDQDAFLMSVDDLKRNLKDRDRYARMTTHDMTRLSAIFFNKHKLNHREFLVTICKNDKIIKAVSFILVTVEDREFLVDINKQEIKAIKTNKLNEIAFNIAFDCLKDEMRLRIDKSNLDEIAKDIQINKLTPNSILGIIGNNTSVQIYKYNALSSSIDGMSVDKFINYVTNSKSIEIKQPSKSVIENLSN